MDDKDKLALFETAVKELLNYKIKSEAKINRLEKVKSLNATSFNENKTKSSKLLEVESISNEFAKLKSEFEWFKLCQRNRATKRAEVKKIGISSKSIKCNTCESAFQTESSLKVHNNLVHKKEPVGKEKVKWKHCIITCSDLDVMNNHIVHEHKFKNGMQQLKKNATYRFIAKQIIDIYWSQSYTPGW